jgi:hypothetical protein
MGGGLSYSRVSVTGDPHGAAFVKRHRFPPAVIRYAVWLYFRCTLSLRDVEEL